MLYAILENGIEEDEWWFVEAFSDQDEAIRCLHDLVEESKSSKYCLVEYKANRVIIKP